MDDQEDLRSLGQLVGQNLQRLRTQRGLTQGDVAKLVSEQGLSWMRAAVSKLETGQRRQIDFAELLTLSLTFDVPITWWVQTDAMLGSIQDHIWLEPARLLLPGEVLRRMAAGKRARMTEEERREFTARIADRASEAEVYAARKLGVTVEEIVEAESALWDCSLDEQRDLILASATRGKLSPASVKIKRGHITRSLLRELAEHLEKGRGRGQADARPEGADRG